MSYDALTTVPAVKAWMKSAGSSDDALIGALIKVASEAIGRYCSRPNLGAVCPYSELYFPNKRSANYSQLSWKIRLRHYPVVSLSSVLINAAAVAVLQPSDVQIGTSGVYLEEDEEPQVLRFYGVFLFDPGNVWVTYTAGYAPNAVPAPLQQACNQAVAEYLRTSANVNLRSVSTAGETTAFDMGGQFGLSRRVEMMLQPFRNMIPWGGR